MRYFAVGEYGSESGRPHYHVIMFGFPTCVLGDSSLGRGRCNCRSCDIVRRTWRYGMFHLGTVEFNSAQYVCGYVTKGMTRADDIRLKGRVPEFCRMSLKPGIGAYAMSEVAKVVRKHNLYCEGDVPSSLRHGSRKMPLGRYLRRRLRVECGRDAGAPAETLEKYKEELRPLREIAASLSDAAVYSEGQVNEEIFRRLLVEQDAERVRQMEARLKLRERSKK